MKKGVTNLAPKFLLFLIVQIAYVLPFLLKQRAYTPIRAQVRVSVILARNMSM